MDQYLLVAVIAIILMLFFAVFVIRNVIKRINENSKKYFMDKLQDYDYLIDERKNELLDLEKSIQTVEDEKELRKELEDFKKNRDEYEIKKSETKKGIKDKQYEEEIVYDLPNPKYRQEEFFKNYKKIKKEFTINSKQTLQEFLDNHKNEKNKNEYNRLKKIKEYFNQNNIYQILTLSSEEQYEVVNKALSTKEKEITQLETYNKNKFTILKFLKGIEVRIKETDPTIYVYVSNEEINYDYMDERIKTIVYKNMSEGIIIQYQNKMYDFSI